MNGPPVVLVHGFGTSYDLTWVSNGWRDLLADEGREVIGVDLLGHGSAPKPHDAAAYADLTTRVADALPVEGEVDAIGFSLGARTLLELAVARPERFRRIVVSGVGANLFRNEGHDAIVDAVKGGSADASPVVRYFAGLGDLPGNDREALAACMSAPRTPFGELDLSVLTMPVLVVLGDEDFAGPADPLVDALPNATLVTLARTDHAKTPKSFAFIDAALDFLR